MTHNPETLEVIARLMKEDPQASADAFLDVWGWWLAGIEAADFKDAQITKLQADYQVLVNNRDDYVELAREATGRANAVHEKLKRIESLADQWEAKGHGSCLRLNCSVCVMHDLSVRMRAILNPEQGTE